MRAWQVSGQGEPGDVLGLVDLPAPEPGAGQVRITVSAAAVGLPDVFMCRAIYPLTPPGAFVPGQEVAGVVSGAGPGTELAVGTRVMGITDFVHGHGGFAEQTIADAANVYEIPACLSEPEAAGFLIAYQTAWIGLVQRARLDPGESVVVLGAAGGTGSAAVQLARALGAEVIAVVSGREKAERARSLGATEVIDRSSEKVSDAVRRLTDGRGADVIYDPVGGAVANDALRAVADQGRFLLIGFASGTWPELPAHDLVVGNFSVLGVYAGACTRAEREQMLSEMTVLVEKGALRPAVATWDFDDLPLALTEIAAGRAQGRQVTIRSDEGGHGGMGLRD